MITLIQAINLLSLYDHEIIHFTTRKHSTDHIATSVKTIREKLNMKNIHVQKIDPYHYRYQTSIAWEFQIPEEEMIEIKKSITKELKA